MQLEIDDIFAGAIEITSDSERADYLAHACGSDAALRARVDKLLAAHFGAGKFMETPAAGLPAALPDDISVGTSIGSYKLMEQIGEGGMGTVFMAEQETPVRRRVALKVIKLGMDTRQVIARFDAERQALALMDHPGIAKVFDAGSTDSGRPYFVMELVKGEPITDYCDRNHLTIQQRLDLFSQVCGAVQHAHQKGLIHRDIKPSNVLVSLQDEQSVAKVIDFGIAKATQSRLTEKTLFTEFNQLIGTPEYMSPEQADGSLDVDTRTDIYSLGVLLYELLVGAPPFEGRELRSKAYAEMQRIIREVDPPAPSTKLSTIEALPSVAANRGVEPRKLGSSVRGELDWIVMKALEKDRSRRYESASALAEDIRHHLLDEPVSAGPPSRVYRVRKFVRRNKAGVAASAAMLLLLIAGSIGTTIGLIREAKQRAEAQRQEKLAKEQTAIAQAISRFQGEMLTSADPKHLLGDKVTVLQAVTAAEQELDAGRLKDNPIVEANVRGVIGATFRALGRFDKAEPNLKKSVEINRRLLSSDDPDLAASIALLATLRLDQERFPESESLYSESLSIARAAPGADPRLLVESLTGLASALHRQNKLDQAEPLYREALQIEQRLEPSGGAQTQFALTNLANLMLSQRKLDQAEPLLREAVASGRKTLPPMHPQLSAMITSLAILLNRQEKFPDAEPLFRESLEINRKTLPEGHPDTATSILNLATNLYYQNKLTEAEPLFREALEISRRTFPQGNSDVSRELNALAVILQNQGKLDQAEPLFRQALEIDRRLLPANHPTIAKTLTSLGWLQRLRGQLVEAEALLEESIQINRQARPATDPETVATLAYFAKVLVDQKKYAQAEPVMLEVEQLLSKTRHPYISQENFIRAIASMYVEWDKSDPGKGYEQQSREWRAKLPATRPATSRAAT